MKKTPCKIVSGASTPTPNRRELADWLAKDGQLLIPLVELLEKGERAIDEVIDVMGRATIEAVLRMSAEQVAGLDSAGCDVQRDYAASLWLRWNDMGVGPGAGVTIKSYTGRVLASAEQGFSGPRFHC